MKREYLVYIVVAITLVEAALSSQARDEQGESLFAAAQQGDLDKIEALLREGVDTDKSNPAGVTALHVAAGAGQKEVCAFLLDKGANINAQAWGNQTPLHWAVQAGRKDIVTLLIEKGADVDAKDAAGRMPIHYALAGKNADVTAFLIMQGKWKGTYEEKELEKVKWLLSQGMDVDAKGLNGNTLLHYAARTGYIHVAALLVGYGADVNARNDSKRTPIQEARRLNNTSLALLLTDAKPGAFLTDQEDLNQWLQNGDVDPHVGEDRSHNVSVVSVKTPLHCAQGDVVPVTITLANNGSYREQFEVCLMNEGDHVRLGSSEEGLAASTEGNILDRADLVFDAEIPTRNFLGNRVCIGGDVNGDGYPEILIGACRWQNGRGRAYLHFGGPDMDTVPDVVLTGENQGDGFSNQSGAFGDVNNDGYDDVIVGAYGTLGHIHDGYVHVYYGGAHMDNVPDVVLKPQPGRQGGFGFMAISEDADNDGYSDILVSERVNQCAYLFWGGDPMSTSTRLVFTGKNAGSHFGHRMVIGGDVNGDGYKDIIIGSRTGGTDHQGQAYLYFGNTRAKIDTECDWIFTGENPKDELGSALDLFDIDGDGLTEVIISARYAGEGVRGRIYIYKGSKTFDGGHADVVLEGEKEGSMGDYIQCGYFNDDRVGDLLVGTFRYPDWMFSHGRAYLFYGNAETLMDSNCDHIFDGDCGTADFFGAQVAIGDVNRDGHLDTLIGAEGANHWMGRAYLHFGPFHSTTDITFNWDTTNVSPGEHTLKASIAPVPREQNTEDNIKTVTIEVKEPHR